MGQGEGETRGPIWLVGMMGAGKSSVGRALARALGRAFVDADIEIAEAAGLSIPEIFAREGEAGFREREASAVEALAARDAVVALGGGALTQPALRRRVAERGVSVYLEASLESLLARVGHGGEATQRPLLAALSREERRARLQALLDERRPHYEAARVTVQTDGASIEQVVARVQEALARAQLGPGEREIPAESGPGGSDPTAAGR